MHVDQRIQQIYEIAQIIQSIPNGRCLPIDLPEYGTTHHKDDVVQHRKGDHSEPLPGEMRQRETQVSIVDYCGSNLWLTL